MKQMDLAVLGGGAVGLSIAYEAANRGKSVVLIDRAVGILKASWAGAGILTPANRKTAVEPLEQLRALSNERHESLAKELLQLTGIDNEHTRCGALIAARSSGDLASLVGSELQWKQEEIEFEVCDVEKIQRIMNGYAVNLNTQAAKRWVHLPDERRIRNSRHLKALRDGCRRHGVEIVETTDCPRLKHHANRITEIITEIGAIDVQNVCVAAGSWTSELTDSIGVSIQTTPVRGQMVLFKLAEPLFREVFYEGSLYLVPRNDGHVLAGSTLEEVGFDASNTDEGVANLIEFASRWFPGLNRDSVVQTWAGLRPATHDGFPYIGRMPEFENGYVATGHFRSGLQLSTGTAMVLMDLMDGVVPCVDLDQFRLGRG